MKKIVFAAILLAAFLSVSCNKDGEFGNASVTFRKANIGGAPMLAIAQGGASTKAEGDGWRRGSPALRDNALSQSYRNLFTSRRATTTSSIRSNSFL